MSTINFQRTYLLSETYEIIKERTIQVLNKYLGYSGLIAFNDLEKSITFFTEKLIPNTTTDRPRVLLLFSNPHPHSIHQGMFLSPNTHGRENLFWPTMGDASWITFTDKIHNPKQLVDICLRVEYQGPFELIFYCYYAFPTDFPEDIIRIFGKEFFRRVIEPEAMDGFKNTIQESNVEAVVTFNKGIFNLVSKTKVQRYIDRLKVGELIQSQIISIERNIPIFLTFPTGWRYDKQYRQYRKTSLDAIRKAINSGLNVPERKDNNIQ